MHRPRTNRGVYEQHIPLALVDGRVVPGTWYTLHHGFRVATT